MPFSARYDERTNSNEPEHTNGDMQAYRHGGDGVGAKMVAARVQGYYPAGLAYVDMQVDANGVLQTAGGGGGGGGAATIADGADIVEGALADAAIVTDTTGTVNGKLRGLVKWAFERMPASLGQKTMAASLPVVIASDQSAVTISGTVTANVGSGTQPVSGTVTANAGTGPFPVSDNAGSLTVDAPVGTPVFVRLSDGSAAITTLPVSVAATLATKETQPTTGTHTNFTGSGAAQTVLSSNANRRGGTLFNDSGVVCYVKFGASASATSFIVKMVDQAYYEIPSPVYTGDVTAFWASGALRVCEIT